MSLVLLALTGAVAVGALLGGTLSRLGRLRLRRLPLVAGALVAQLLGAVLAPPLGRGAWVAGLALSAVLAAGFVAANLRAPGLPLVAGGLLLNALVVGANGAMPVSPTAAARAGVGLGPVLVGQDLRHEVTEPGTRLRLLGDVVPFPLPGLPQVLSPGDVLVAAGVAQLVVAGMLQPRRSSTAPGPPPAVRTRPRPAPAPPRAAGPGAPTRR